MQVKFIAQAFNPEVADAAGTELLACLKKQEVTSLLVLTAFASASGINVLQEGLANSSVQTVRVIVGIDQHGTSQEALESLLALQEAYAATQAWIFYQPEAVIYHPKLYLLEGPEEVQVLIGSSNLTGNGLFRNVEAGTLLTLRPSEAADAQWLAAFYQQLAGFRDCSDPNLKPLSAGLITEVVAAGLVPDEATVRQRYAKNNSAKPAAKPSGAPLFLRRKVIRSGARKPKRAPAAAKPATGPVTAADFQLVWQRVGLPASSVQQAGAGTNPTGGLRLVQARYQAAGAPIDQTSYFRETLFGHLVWHEASHHPFVEITTVLFQVAILGEELGDIPLSVRHKPSGEAGQHNYTTSISWGSLGKAIQEANLVGKTVRLLRAETAPPRFRLEFH